MNIYSFSVIGGDFRAIASANKLSKAGHIVKAFGFDDCRDFDDNIIIAKNLDSALEGCEFVLLPLPSTKQNGEISTPLSNEKLTVSTLLNKLNTSQKVFAGKTDNLLKDALELKKIKYFDYFTYEDFTVKNAVPTAEGAIEIALRELPITLNGAKCLVTGFGRISKLLSSLLKSFGAHVTVSARRHSDIAWITAMGYDALYISELSGHIHKADVIFNTVPHKIFDANLLCQIKKDCLLIDLASKPGGVDFDEAQKLGLNIIWALSLPGKVAPLSAGEIITETVLNIIKEQEENNGTKR